MGWQPGSGAVARWLGSQRAADQPLGRPASQVACWVIDQPASGQVAVGHRHYRRNRTACRSLTLVVHRAGSECRPTQFPLLGLLTLPEKEYDSRPTLLEATIGQKSNS